MSFRNFWTAYLEKGSSSLKTEGKASADCQPEIKNHKSGNDGKENQPRGGGKVAEAASPHRGKFLLNTLFI